MNLTVAFSEDNKATMAVEFEEQDRNLSPDFGQVNTVNIGENGLSAYEIAVQHGFEGTEAEWLESLKGEDGHDGATGKDGANGVSATHQWNGTTLIVSSASGTSSADLKGEKGDTGVQGPQGIQGEKGATGANGADGYSVLTISQKVTSLTAINVPFSLFNKVPRVGDYAISQNNFLYLVVAITGTSARMTYCTDMNGKQGAAGKDGKDGINGKDGADGYTPIKGTDYFTDADKAEMVSSVISALPVYDGSVITV